MFDEVTEAPKPLKLDHHEVTFWGQAYLFFCHRNNWSLAASQADKAVLALRERYNPNNKQGPYR